MYEFFYTTRRREQSTLEIHTFTFCYQYNYFSNYNKRIIPVVLRIKTLIEVSYRKICKISISDILGGCKTILSGILAAYKIIFSGILAAFKIFLIDYPTRFIYWHLRTATAYTAWFVGTYQIFGVIMVLLGTKFVVALNIGFLGLAFHIISLGNIV